MRLSYDATAGVRGVTRLMAVGDTEYETDLASCVRHGTWIAGGVAAVGVVFGSRTLRGVGAGALLALLGVKLASKRAHPAPAPTSN